MKHYKISLIIAIYVSIFPAQIYAESKNYELKKIVITPSRIFRKTLPARSIFLITQDQIKDSPSGDSIPDLFCHTPGIDIRRRGASGIQADVNIRDSSFDQVLFMIDGQRVNDPQTGHHNMDIPFTTYDIERIEILRGGASSLYGPNAFGGVINIITKRPVKEKNIVELIIGDFGKNSEGLSINHAITNFSNRISFQRGESDGYRPNTDYRYFTISDTATFSSPAGDIDFLYGFNRKDFGADSFYSDRYPKEEEHTRTQFASINLKKEFTRFSILPRFWLRRHQDKFILDRSRKPWYTNFHTTYTYGTEFSSGFDLGFGKLIIGTEVSQDKITSTNLGNHSRTHSAFYTEFEPDIENLSIDTQLRFDKYSGWDLEVLPALNLGLSLKEFVHLRASGGRSFRVPTYTDLYYSDPANRGNPNLTAESAWHYEIGVDFKKADNSLDITLFTKKGKDIIDWTRQNPSDVWQVTNLSEVDTDGFEVLYSYEPAKEQFLNLNLMQLGYSYIYSKKHALTGESKYALDYLKHHAYIGIENRISNSLKLNLKASYKQRLESRPYFIIDSRISKKIEDLELFIECTNLLNTSYQELKGIPSAGRWISAGVRKEF